MSQFFDQEDTITGSVFLYALEDKNYSKNLDGLKRAFTALNDVPLILKPVFYPPIQKGATIEDTIKLVSTIYKRTKENRGAGIGLLPYDLLDYHLTDLKKCSILSGSNPFPDIQLSIGSFEFEVGEPAKNTIRIGKIRQEGLHYVEPFLRDIETMILDLSILKSDSEPFGFQPEEFCQILYYAGTCSTVNNIYILSENPFSEYQTKTMGVALWYFIQGQEFRLTNTQPDPASCYEFLLENEEDGKVYHFFREKGIDRWWYKIINEVNLTPCSIDTYENAKRGDWPSALSMD
jgi:hypothetical protein